MGRTGLAVASLWMGIALAPSWAAAAHAHGDEQIDSHNARLVSKWAVANADHRQSPFAVVDKQGARIYVFEADGRIVGSSPALLGQTLGDVSAPDVGSNAQAGFVPVHERTTPAGRFVSSPGRNLTGEQVIWVDYKSAFAIHRVREGASRDARNARLATPTPADNRVSLGCVVVPGAFYDEVVQRVLGHGRAVIYVLPEERSVREVFGSM